MKYVVIVLAILGVVTLVGNDAPTPHFQSLSWEIDPHRVSSPTCIFEGTSDETRWQGLQGAIGILDEVNPEVAHWVRRLHEKGKLVFDDSDAGRAKFGFLDRQLRICRGTFAECDGMIAAILCHEYRHACQGVNRVLQYGFSHWRVKDGDISILENDAYLYELEAVSAIFPNSDHRNGYKNEVLMAHLQVVRGL